MSHILFPRPALRFGFASLTFTTRWAGEQTQHPLYHGQETQKIVTNPFQDLTCCVESVIWSRLPEKS